GVAVVPLAGEHIDLRERPPHNPSLSEKAFEESVVLGDQPVCAEPDVGAESGGRVVNNAIAARLVTLLRANDLELRDRDELHRVGLCRAVLEEAVARDRE